jgi:hypothetical protein
MKNKLWAFGDSYTAGVLPDIDHFPPYIEYLKYLGISKEEFPLGWPYQLANKLNLEPSVVAVGGASNDEIIINLYQNIPNFKKGDVVIVQWSYLSRFLWAIKPEHYNHDNSIDNIWSMFQRASHNTQSEEKNEFTSENVFKSVSYNKTLPGWILRIDLIESLLKYISNIVGFKLYFWSSDNFIHLSKEDKLLNNSQYILYDVVFNYAKLNEDIDNKFLESIRELGATSISQETECLISDGYHLGIKGNEVFCNLVYNHLINSK